MSEWLTGAATDSFDVQNPLPLYHQFKAKQYQRYHYLTAITENGM